MGQKISSSVARNSQGECSQSSVYLLMHGVMRRQWHGPLLCSVSGGALLAMGVLPGVDQ